MSDTRVREASERDIPLILTFIRELADYEKLSHEVVATEEGLRESLFAGRRYAEVLIAEHDGAPAGFALYFHNFSTFLGKPGIYLEDLYVRPELRESGIGRQLLVKLAHLALQRGCGRLEWSVLDWNEPSIGFYRQLGAVAMDDWTVYRVSDDALRKLGGGG
jgi:GNAT superfamily N-acetyltransferase